MDDPHKTHVLQYLVVVIMVLCALAVKNRREERTESYQVIFNDFLRAIKDYYLFGIAIDTDKMYELKCLPPVKLTKLLFVAIKRKCPPDVVTELIAMGASKDGAAAELRRRSC